MMWGHISMNLFNNQKSRFQSTFLTVLTNANNNKTTTSTKSSQTSPWGYGISTFILQINLSLWTIRWKSMWFYLLLLYSKSIHDWETVTCSTGNVSNRWIPYEKELSDISGKCNQMWLWLFGKQCILKWDLRHHMCFDSVLVLKKMNIGKNKTILDVPFFIFRHSWKRYLFPPEVSQQVENGLKGDFGGKSMWGFDEGNHWGILGFGTFHPN